MPERVIWAIGGVKFSIKNGQMIIPPDDLQYMKVEFVSSLLDDLKFPYRKEWRKSIKYKNFLMYRFVVDETSNKQVSTDDIYVVQNILKMALR